LVGEDVPPAVPGEEAENDDGQAAPDDQPNQDQPNFKAALQALLLQHGKTLNDLTKPKQVNDVIIKHVIDSSPSHLARRLRQFSGRSPLPNGEVDYSTWRQSARQLIQESDVKVSEKKQRIKQSLVGQACELVLVLDKEIAKKGGAAKAEDYVAALDKMFGICLDGDDLYSEFRALYQQHGEDPGDYLVSLHTKLDTVVEYGGADDCQRDRLLLGQFTRGCLHDEYLLEKLQLEQKKSNPPDFITFLHDVRTAATKHKERESRRSQQNVKPTKARVQKHDVKPESDGRISQLEEQIKKLGQVVENLAVAIQTPRQESRRPPSNYQQKPQRKGVCFNCGEEGHRMADCTNATNATLLQRRLAGKFGKQQGNDRGRLQGATRCLRTSNQHPYYPHSMSGDQHII
jgi:hypothetical protein